MNDQLGERDVRRAVRWLERSGGLLPVTREVGDLLARRLAARHRIVLRVLPLVVLAGVITLVGTWSDVPTGEDPAAGTGIPGDRRPEESLPLLGLFAVASGARLVLELLVAAADRRIARSLPHVVRREHRAPTWVVLGRVQAGALALGVGLTGVSIAVVWASRPTWPAATVSVLALLAVGCCLLSVQVVVRRPAVAVDGVSLAVDERLRTEEAASTLVVLFLCSLTLSNHGQNLGDGAWGTISTICTLAGMAALVVVAIRPGWRPERRQTWAEPVRDVQVSGG